MLASTQELQHSTRNFVKLEGDYLGSDILICLSMETWPCHIDRFERQYEKAFAKESLFWADLMYRIHKTCSGVFILLQHVRHRGRGVGGPHGVQWSSEEGGKRGMVDLDAGMGGSVSTKGEETMEIRRTWCWSMAERQGSWTRIGVQQHSRPATTDHGETRRDDGDGALGEPPLPLGGGW